MMSAAAATMAPGDAAGAGGAKKGGKKKLIILAIPVLLIAIGAGLWFTGILPNMLGMGHKEESAEHAGKEKEKEAHAPVFVELPEMIANLNAPGRRASFVKLKVRLELSKEADQAPFTAAQPRVIDLFQTYLREMRPDELRGSAGSYRLREELIARASLAAAPATVVDVLFSELLVQ
jgi:flagellar FliL protein